MKKVYISQPMVDKKDDEIKKERKRAIDLVEKQLEEYVEEIDSFFEKSPHEAKPLWFLGKSLQLLSGADIAFFCKGWEHYRGCKIEHEACVAYGIKCIEEE